MTARAFALCAVFLAALGCGGGSKASVQGSVTSGGKPVVWGTVILVDATGAYHQGDISLTGTFDIPNVPTGAVKIGVSSPNPVDPRSGGRPGGGGGRPAPDGKGGAGGLDDPRSKYLAEKGGGEAPRPTPPAGAWFPLPNAQKNSDPLQSGLTGEVKSGQPLNIDVK